MAEKVVNFPVSNRKPPTGGGDGGDMEARVTKLELIAEKTSERLGALERDVALIRSKVEEFPDHFATKADLHREINSQTWKLVTFVSGFGTALVAATYFIATHVK